MIGKGSESSKLRNLRLRYIYKSKTHLLQTMSGSSIEPRKCLLKDKDNIYRILQIKPCLIIF